MRQPKPNNEMQLDAMTDTYGSIDTNPQTGGDNCWQYGCKGTLVNVADEPNVTLQCTKCGWVPVE